jgi:hypothetical protein
MIPGLLRKVRKVGILRQQAQLGGERRPDVFGDKQRRPIADESTNYFTSAEQGMYFCQQLESDRTSILPCTFQSTDVPPALCIRRTLPHSASSWTGSCPVEEALERHYRAFPADRLAAQIYILSWLEG